MFSAFQRAIGQLTDPPILRAIGTSVLLCILCFAVTWAGIGWALSSLHVTGETWIDAILGLLGGFATLVITWFLFPPVASAILAMFLERVVVVVEARHYPDLPRAPGQPWMPTIANSCRFLALIIVLNALLLLLWLIWFAPFAYPIGYYCVNGLLLGREYLELVALRRLDVATMRRLRARHSTEVFGMGLVCAVLLTIPFVNFVAPVLLVAATVHRVEHWRRAAGAPSLR